MRFSAYLFDLQKDLLVEKLEGKLVVWQSSDI
jgi:hypothetical protein